MSPANLGLRFALEIGAIIGIGGLVSEIADNIVLTYGIPNDLPVTGDWNNDGIDTIGIYRGDTFYLRNSNTNGVADMTFSLGLDGDVPISGNWDGLP